MSELTLKHGTSHEAGIYTDGQSSVRLGQHVSSPLPLGCGVRGATGVHLISSIIPTCHGPSVATASLSLWMPQSTTCTLVAFYTWMTSVR